MTSWLCFFVIINIYTFSAHNLYSFKTEPVLSCVPFVSQTTVVYLYTWYVYRSMCTVVWTVVVVSFHPVTHWLSGYDAYYDIYHTYKSPIKCLTATLSIGIYFCWDHRVHQCPIQHDEWSYICALNLSFARRGFNSRNKYNNQYTDQQN